MPITATRDAAIAKTAIGLVLVSIVTILKARFSFCDVTTLNTIAALRQCANICARVSRKGVAVITLLLRINDSIAADLKTAIRSTVVANLIIAVVTGFEAFISSNEIGSLNSIAASGNLAGIGARILINAIGIIAAFVVSPHKPVAAACWLA